MIAIVDYGMGNLGSIHNMLLKIGAESVVTSDAQVITEADKLILPGVGAFDKAMEHLTELGLIPVLNELVLEQKKPLLGICLGMQLMSRTSEEGTLPGLGWIDAETIKFRFEPELQHLRIPHMGWNTITPNQDHPILANLPDESRFYFVHSYHVKCKNDANVLATAEYGIPFHCAIIRDNIIGMQFHPEKSHRFGLAVLRNYVEAPN